MRIRAAMCVLAIAVGTSACAGGWNRMGSTREPAPSSRVQRVRLVLREAPPLVLDHARVFPDSVVQMEMASGEPVRVRSIPMSQVRRVELWESGGARTAGVVAVVVGSSAALFFVLISALATMA